MKARPATTPVCFIVLVVAILTTGGCKQKPKLSGQGFSFSTQYCVHPLGESVSDPCNPNTDQINPFPHVSISGVKTGDLPNEQGNIWEFGWVWNQPTVQTDNGQYTNGVPYLFISGAVAPAIWDIRPIMTRNCGPGNLYATGLYPGTTTQVWEYDFPGTKFPDPAYDQDAIYCQVQSTLNAASTRFALIGSFPSTITLQGDQTYTTEWGMPVMYAYSSSGLVATETATSISPDGSEATFPFPSSLSESGYSLAVANQVPTGDGYVPNGFNLLSIASSQTIAGNPFGVGAQFSSTTWYSYDNDDPYGDGTCAGEWVINSGTYGNPFPV